MDAVDVEEIDAGRDVALNDLGSSGFDTLRERCAIERIGEAIVIYAGFFARTGQREADAVASTSTEPCAPGPAGRIDHGAQEFFIKSGGFFMVRHVDEDLVDRRRSDQRLRLGAS